MPKSYRVLVASEHYSEEFSVVFSLCDVSPFLVSRSPNVVANGSFLVNLQLVNKEHRKLAGKLIDEVPKGSRVVFIEANAPSQVRSSRGGGWRAASNGRHL